MACPSSWSLRRQVPSASEGRRARTPASRGQPVLETDSRRALAHLLGGRIRANIKVQDARQEQALRQYEKSILIALEEVENALSAHARELARQQSLRASVAANRRALDLATERYRSGLESFLSVLDAQRSVFAAEDQLVQSERNAAVSLVAVYKSLGGGWSPSGGD